MNKNNYHQIKFKNLEKIKWLFISIFFILSFFVNYYFYGTSLYFRMLIISFLIICAVVMAFYTRKGKEILLYINMSKKEIQKIIWPNYKETLYTTFIVISVTIFISLILWGLDSLIFRLIAFIISLRF